MKKPIKCTQDTFTLALKSQTGIIAVKEYMFHDKRKWRFDYAIPDKKLAIEVDGARFKTRTYTDKSGRLITTKGGRHNSGKGYEDDCEKKNHAAMLGWRVLVVFPETLFNLKTFEMIIQSTL
jgi:very-short-patch-repair endonuclease